MKLTKEIINQPGFALFKGAASQEDSAKLTHGFRSAAVETGFFRGDSQWTAAIETAGSEVETLHIEYGSITAALTPIKALIPIKVPDKEYLGVTLYATAKVFFGSPLLNLEIKWGMSGKSYRTALGQIFKSMVLADKAASAIKEFNKNYKKFIVSKVFA
jgi:hypothetical protein